MQIEIGKIVDTDADVNLVSLKPIDRIIAAATNAYHNTKLYKRKATEEAEKREKKRRKAREACTDALLSIINQELASNKTLMSKGDKCKAILVQAPYKFEPFLKEVIESHEFDAFDITIIKPTSFLSRVADVPSLLHIKAKEVISSV